MVPHYCGGGEVIEQRWIMLAFFLVLWGMLARYVYQTRADVEARFPQPWLALGTLGVLIFAIAMAIGIILAPSDPFRCQPVHFLTC
jgi:hypothetical protein